MGTINPMRSKAGPFPLHLLVIIFVYLVAGTAVCNWCGARRVERERVSHDGGAP
jgi:hypothetical protein